MKFNKIGFYFGNFNPIHEGHIYAIKNALNTTIDQLHLIVSSQSPFKKINEDTAPFQDRCEMVKLAIKSHKLDDKVIVNSSEKGKNPSYTSDTLKLLKPLFVNNDMILFLGLDDFLTIDKWKDAKYILENYTIYIIPRNCTDASELIQKKKEELIKNITQNIKSIGYSNPFKTFDMSASDIRNLVKLGKPIDNMVVKEVEEYIENNNLYKNQEETLF